MTVPLGNDAVEMDKVGTTVIAKLALALIAVGVVVSVTEIVAVLVPVVVGVPLITPVPELIDNPAGRPVADQV